MLTCGSIWEGLCLRPAQVRTFAAELARRVAAYRIDAVCGALNEGAFVALMVASELDVEFSYTERFAPPPSRVWSRVSPKATATQVPHAAWTPSECLLCAAGVPFDD